MPAHGPDRSSTNLAMLLQIIVTACLYFLFGKLGLRWAIPPGYASMIWLPTGIALLSVIIFGRHTLIGIFIGSFCVNFLRTGDNSAIDPSMVDAVVSLGIGCGATIEAFVAGWLLRKTVSRIPKADSDLEIAKFFLLAGPVACLINPLVACGTLYFAGFITLSNFPANFVNWWIGDSVGAMVLAPAIFVIDQKRWAVRWHRFHILFWPVLFCFVSTIAIFHHAKKLKEQEFNQNLKPKFDDVINSFERNITRYKDLLIFSKSLFTVEAYPTRAEFKKHTSQMFDRYPGLIGLSWIPVIPHSQRDQWVKQAREEGVSDFEFQESTKGPSSRHVAPKREYYSIIYYNENLKNDTKVIGQNLNSTDLRAQAMNQAEVTKNIAATGLLTLFSGNGQYFGSVMYLPIMQTEMKHTLLSQNKHAVMAFVSLALQTDAMIEGAVGHLLGKDFNLTISERGPQGVSKIFAWGKPHDITRPGAYEVMREVEGITAYPWQFSFSPTLSYLKQHQDFVPWYFLVAGMIGTCTIAGLLLSMIFSKETVQAEILVRRETETNLAAINRDLIIREKELEIAKRAAEDANKAKDAFLANMSHEIRTPLAAVLGFSELIATGRKSSEEILKFRDTIRRNGQLLNSIISDILDLSTIEAGKFSIAITEANLPEILDDVETILRPEAGRKSLTLTYIVNDDVPKFISTDPNRLRQILLNIIGNAVKFTSKGSVTVTVKLTDETDSKLCIEVIDTGPGIDPEKTPLLFRPFSQLDDSINRMHGGSGLGLSLSRWLARYLGGDVTLEQTRQETGCCFRIVINHKPEPDRG